VTVEVLRCEPPPECHTLRGVLPHDLDLRERLALRRAHHNRPHALAHTQFIDQIFAAISCHVTYLTAIIAISKSSPFHLTFNHK